MKKLYNLILFLLFSTATKAQFVSISDTAFVSFLKAKYPSAMSGSLLDTNNSFVVNDTVMDCNSKGISDLYGVQFFDKLKYLFCRHNTLTYLPSLPNSLKKLICDDNKLASLPALPDSIGELWVYDNNLSSLPVLPSSLNALWCSNNNLTSLPALPSSIQYLNCNNNSLTSLPSLPSLLTILRCDSNNLTSLPTLSSSINQLYCNFNNITSLPILPFSLKELSCIDNNLTTMPTLPDSLYWLYCSKNNLSSLPFLPKRLIGLWCDSNNLKSLPNLPPKLESLVCHDNPSLYCLPPYSQNSFGGCFQVRRNTGISCLPKSTSFGICRSVDSSEYLPVCSIISGCPVMDKFVGNVHEDTSVSCALDSLNNGPLSPKIKLKKYKNGILDYQVYTNYAGHYSFDGALGDSIDVMIDTAGLSLEVSCPTTGIRSARVSLTDSIFYNRDFGVRCKGVDLGVESIYGTFRKGATRPVYILAGDLSQAYNLNCGDGSSGTVITTFSDSAYYDSPLPGALTPSTISGNKLIYTISDFGAINLDSAFNFLLRIPATAALGSDVCIHTVVTTTATDINHTNDSLIFCGQVVNSFDPNNKLVFPSATIGPDEWLTYTINFQNTGTDTAYQVIVRDTLDSHLNLGSFTFLASSHNPQIDIKGSAVMFNFPHINLLDSFHHELESHGWIQYKIKTAADLAPYTTVTNRASIYFDDNDPILTNTTSNINTPLNIQVNTQAPVFKIYPNPASSSITLESREIGEFRMIDLLGSLVYKSSIHNPNTPLNITLPKLANGLYIYQFESDSKMRQVGKLHIQSN